MAITATPITASIGAEVDGVDLAHVSDDDLETLHELFLEHMVLVFRDQHITTDEHIAFGRLWGELEIHPFIVDDGDHPELVVLHSTPEKPIAAERWHSDVTWREEPSLGSILRGCIIPPAGGDTCFSNAVDAYEGLSDGWKERLDGAVAVHDFTHTFGRGLDAEELARQRERFPAARHPVVRTHPETGKKAIYTNRYFTSHIEGVDEDESKEVLAHLERAVMSPNVQCRIRWDVDTFVMWDNRCTQHFATSDFHPAERRVERVTVAGDRPF